MSERGAVDDPVSDFEDRTSRMEGQADKPAHPLAELQLAYPDGIAPVGVFSDRPIHRHEGRGPVMVGDIPLDSARDPGAEHSDEGRLDDALTIKEIVAVRLVDRFEDPASDLEQYAIADIFVLQDKRRVRLVHALVGHQIREGIRIDRTLGALTGSTEIKHRVALGRPGKVSRDDQILPPSRNSRAAGPEIRRSQRKDANDPSQQNAEPKATLLPHFF